MYQATLTETFTATHALAGVRPKPHSHRWVVRVTVSVPDDGLSEPGFVVNYYELKPLVRSLLPEGKHLNDEYPVVPTAENLAKVFYDRLKPVLPQLESVSVGEFEQFMCTYRPDA